MIIIVKKMQFNNKWLQWDIKNIVMIVLEYFEINQILALNNP